MRVGEVAGLAPELEGAVVELRQKTLSAVVRQQALREQLRRLRARAGQIEERASRALGRGEELVARQILARGLCTLQERDVLEEELAAARRHVVELLAAMVRSENRAWQTATRPEAATLTSFGRLRGEPVPG
jgi:phage shock protein A